MTLPSNYRNQVYAGWLGKCIGVRFGAPLETWTYDEIRANLGEVTGYLRDDAGKVFKPDDDTAVPMLLLRALEDHGPNLTHEALVQTWLNYFGDQHGTIWWGGYGISTEHTVYLNLASGITAPRSGSIAQNGAALAEQIGGQIFSDIWGWVAPGQPARAADLGGLAASVTHDGNGIYGGRFVAALVSAAFNERDPKRLLEIGLEQIPVDSDYTRVIQAMIDFHQQHPDDWHAGYAHLKANYGYDRYPGEVPIVPNAGVIALGLLYGAGDFTRSLQITNMAGWDTDCNVGNVGAILGTALGVDGIDPSWREPINDLLIASGLIGTRNILTIPQCADLIYALGCQMNGAGETVETVPRYHFHYPGSTSNFQARGAKARAVHVVHEAVQKRLHTLIRRLSKKGEIRVFTRTYYRPSELSSNYYEACFTPLIAPGQTVEAVVGLPADAAPSLSAALYVYDDNGRATHQGLSQPITPGETAVLRFDIPPLRDACLSEVGVVLRNLDEVWEKGALHIERLGWSGTPNYETTFARERPESGGVSQWTRLRGYWRLEDGAYHGSGVGLCESYSGAVEWEDYTVEADLIPLVGHYHAVHARVRGALSSYAFALAPKGHVALYRKAGGYQLVESVPFAWNPGQRYTLALSAQGDHLTAYATSPDDGTTAALQWRDTDGAYRSGQIGLSTWYGGHTRFQAVRVRPNAD